MNRRHFLHSAIAAALVTSLGAAEKRAPRILFRSAWQTVNIGDIAHTPGILALLEKYLPDAQIHLWPSVIDRGVDQLLLKRFPKLKIVKKSEEIATAFKECDFLLHGSGASFVAEKDVRRWHTETGKPFGVYCISVPQYPAHLEHLVVSKSPGKPTMDLLTQAKFVYFRDSVSMNRAKELGCACPVMEFGPDGAFGTDLRNDAAAEAFLNANDLKEGRFLCCIPRLRISPYWKMKPNTPIVPERHARNEEMKEHDHAPLREAITLVARQTDLKILLCPEDSSQMELGKEMLLDKLPDDVKKRVVWRQDYWLTDEALSTYVRSAGLFGNEMHSPILCIAHGIPAIVCRWAEQTTKGTMWRDIGLSDWVFDFDIEEEVKRMPGTVLALAKDLKAAKAKAVKAQQFVQQRQRETMGFLKQKLAA